MYICRYGNVFQYTIFAFVKCTAVCVCEKNVVHCASTMAIFNVQIVSSFYIFKMDFIMFVRDSNSIIKHIYNVDCNNRKECKLFGAHQQQKRPLCHTKPQFTMYAIQQQQQQIPYIDVQLTTHAYGHCNFISHNIKWMYASKIEFMMKIIVVKKIKFSYIDMENYMNSSISPLFEMVAISMLSQCFFGFPVQFLY